MNFWSYVFYGILIAFGFYVLLRKHNIKATEDMETPRPPDPHPHPYLIKAPTGIEKEMAAPVVESDESWQASEALLNTPAVAPEPPVADQPRPVAIEKTPKAPAKRAKKAAKSAPKKTAKKK